MIPYKTSKDYKRLKELLDEGEYIVTFYEQKWSDGYITKGCEFAYKDDYACHIANSTHFAWEEDHLPFEKLCEKYNVEFIEPDL